MADQISLRVVQKIADVARDRWDALIGAATPFLKWDWLESLEQAGCVNDKTGWLPHHIVVEKGGDLIAACPMYLKLQSMGEFVFAYDWAEAAQHAGIQYYPKMLVGVPFTPVTGHRFITAPGEDRSQLIQFMGQALAKIAAFFDELHKRFAANLSLMLAERDGKVIPAPSMCATTRRCTAAIGAVSRSIRFCTSTSATIPPSNADRQRSRKDAYGALYEYVDISREWISLKNGCFRAHELHFTAVYVTICQ